MLSRWSLGALQAYFRVDPPIVAPRLDDEVRRGVGRVVDAALGGRPLLEPASKRVLDAAIQVAMASGNARNVARVQAVLVEAVVEEVLQEDIGDLVSSFGCPLVPSLGVKAGTVWIGFLDYVGLGMTGRYALGCQVVVAGRVLLGYTQLRLLLVRRLLSFESYGVFSEIPGWIHRGLGTVLHRMQVADRQEAQTERANLLHGMQSEHYPPCVRWFLDQVDAGVVLSHPMRFNLVVFLRNLGMSVDELVRLFGDVPGFDAAKTRYQVEHITGVRGPATRNGRGYRIMSCSKMRVHGICPDHGCPGTTPLNQYHYTVMAADGAR